MSLTVVGSIFGSVVECNDKRRVVVLCWMVVKLKANGINKQAHVKSLGVNPCLIMEKYFYFCTGGSHKPQYLLEFVFNWLLFIAPSIVVLMLQKDRGVAYADTFVVVVTFLLNCYVFFFCLFFSRHKFLTQRATRTQQLNLASSKW
jgi:hypothetical protein